MGWCSGTDVFDTVVKGVLCLCIRDKEKIDIIENLIVALHDQDWDCETDSEYFHDPLVKLAFLQLDEDYWKLVYSELEALKEE